MNVVIYARFSSHSQTEQSIEGQLKVCHEYAEANSHVVIGEYIDRAQSGTTDNRAEFQRMIADSGKHTFDAVLVYRLDRFARTAMMAPSTKRNSRKTASSQKNHIIILVQRKNRILLCLLLVVSKSKNAITYTKHAQAKKAIKCLIGL